MPFATIDLASGRAIGSSRYMTITPEHRRLEIGWTWIGTAFQRTGANREAKLLQLGHAFEALGRGTGGVQDPRPQRAVPRRRCWASAPRSRASCATTRSCPTGPTATPRSTASSPGSGPTSRPGSRRGLESVDRPITTVDYHTGGEPFRIVTGGVPALEGRTVPDRRRWAAANLDHVRQLLVNEPRGHADMYGCFVTPAGRRRRRPRRRLLPQRGLLDSLRPRHDRAGHLGDRVRPDPGPAGRPVRGGHRGRAERPAGVQGPPRRRRPGRGRAVPERPVVRAGPGRDDRDVPRPAHARHRRSAARSTARSTSRQLGLRRGARGTPRADRPAT